MDEKKIYAGLGALVVVLLGVGVFATGGEDETRQQAALADSVAQAEARADALEGQVADLGAALSDIQEQVAGAASAADLGAVQEAVSGLEAQASETAAALSQLTERAASAEAAAVEALAVASDAQTMAAAVPAPAPAPADAAPATRETASAPAQDDAVAPGTTAGQTLLFADGALRVFVSRVDADAKQARLSVNGTMKTLAAGDSRTLAVADDYCRLTVNGVTRGGADVSALCGDDLPMPEGLTAGQTALFQDGKLRVFASRITEDMARVSANGTMLELEPGTSGPVMAGDESCRVKVVAVDRGHVQLDAACGPEYAVSDLVGPGKTVILGNGAARVFVAGVSEDKIVRFAVNGQTLSQAAAGERVILADGCAVGVEGVKGNSANFSFVCDD